MKKACRLAILMSMLLCVLAFVMATPGYAEALGVAPSDAEPRIAIARSGAGSCSQVGHEDDQVTLESDPADDIPVACEDLAPFVGEPVVQSSSIVTSHTLPSHPTRDPVRPGYLPDGTPVYRLPAHGRHPVRSPCNVSVPRPTGARARLTC